VASPAAVFTYEAAPELSADDSAFLGNSLDQEGATTLSAGDENKALPVFLQRARDYANWYACKRGSSSSTPSGMIACGWSNFDTTYYNHNFPVITGEDCTNFISQIFFHAGWRMDSRWYARKIAGPHGPAWVWGHPWTVVGTDPLAPNPSSTAGFINYVRAYRSGWVAAAGVLRVSDALPGDIVVFDQSYDGKVNPDHLDFVTGRDSGHPILAAHGRNLRDANWWDIVAHYKADHGGKVFAHVWLLRVRHY
jgi:hypothetical protein